MKRITFEKLNECATAALENVIIENSIADDDYLRLSILNSSSVMTRAILTHVLKEFELYDEEN